MPKLFKKISIKEDYMYNLLFLLEAASITFGVWLMNKNKLCKTGKAIVFASILALVITAIMADNKENFHKKFSEPPTPQMVSSLYQQCIAQGGSEFRIHHVGGKAAIRGWWVTCED